MLSLFAAEIMCYTTDDTLRLIRREELSMPLIVTLNVVERRGAISISEISTSLDFSLGNTSMLVDKLVCKGFVTRAEDAHDRRHKVVRLTEKGQALIQELRAARVEGMVQRLLLLSPALVDHTIDVLRDVIAQLPLIGTERRAERP
ncbi:MAG: MarR family winged helix-turn-helix transcriptional regulator [Roseiflexaceae bacterium]